MANTSPSDVTKSIIEDYAWLRRSVEAWPEKIKMLEEEPITPMDRKTFSKFANWLKNCKGEIGDYIDFEKKISQAFADQATRPQRMKQVISNLFDILIFDLSPASDQEEARRLGAPLVHILQCLSHSASLDEVRVKRIENSDVCVLLCGFAGSHLDDVMPQTDWYNSLGFSTICSSRVIYPHKMHIRQLLNLGQCLVEAVSEGTKLIVHICSGGGESLWNELSLRWVAGLAPFDKLPPLNTCLKGLVFECTGANMPNRFGEAFVPPGTPFYEESGGASQLVAPDPSTTGEYSSSQPPDHSTELDAFRVFSTLGLIGNMCQYHCPDVSAHKVSAKPGMMSYIRTACYHPGFWYTSETCPAGYHPACYDTLFEASQQCWLKIEVELFDKQVPRCILTSERDFVITVDMVKRFIAFHKKFFPEPIFTHICSKADHCKLFISDEREECVNAVTGLLKAAGVLP